MILIIENPELTHLSTEAIVYLQKNSNHHFKICGDKNILKTIIEFYTNGCRHFILSLIQDQLLELTGIFEKLIDAKFVSTAFCPTTDGIRLKNLLYTVSSDSYLKGLDLEEGLLVYKKFNPSIPFKNKNFYCCSLLDFNKEEAANHKNIYIFGQIWPEVIEKLTDQNHKLWGLASPPPENLIFPNKILELKVIYPQPSIRPHQNTFWNQLTKIRNFSLTNPSNSIYPFLLNQDWNELIELGIITSKRINNGYYISSETNLSSFYNMDNDYIQIKGPIVQISQKEEKDLGYPIFKSKKIESKIKKHHKLGARKFILDASTKQLIKILNSEKWTDSLFICPFTSDPDLRRANSNFLFSLEEDKQTLSEICRQHKNIFFILGEDKSVNKFVIIKELSIRKISYFTVKEVLKEKVLPAYEGTIYVVANEEEWDKIKNLSRRRGQNLLKYQSKSLCNPLFYGQNYWLDNIKNLYKFDIGFLFRFGYIVDC